MSEAEEQEVLAECDREAEGGQMLTAAKVREKLEKRLGRVVDHSYTYRVMKRHGWRKVMPRTKHPKAASKEEQDSSKKTKLSTTNSFSKTPAKMFD